MGSKTFNENAIRARIAHGGYYPVSDAIDLTTLMDERVTLRARVVQLEAAVTAAHVFLADKGATTMLCEDCGTTPAEYTIQGYAFCLPCAREELGYTPAEIDRISWIADGTTVYALTAVTSKRKPVQVNRWSIQVQGGGEHGLCPDECAALAQQIAAVPELWREIARLRAALEK